jgi:ribonuclease HI
MRVTIIADASHCPDTRAAGYGFWVASERGKRGGGGSMRGTVDSSSAAEMMACVNALFHGCFMGLVQPGDHVLVQTDCIAAIQAFEGQRNSLTKDEREAVRSFRSLRKEKSVSVSFRHVKGHTKRTEARYVTNNLCDKRAKEGMRRSRAVLLKEKRSEA